MRRCHTRWTWGEIIFCDSLEWSGMNTNDVHMWLRWRCLWPMTKETFWCFRRQRNLGRRVQRLALSFILNLPWFFAFCSRPVQWWVRTRWLTQWRWSTSQRLSVFRSSRELHRKVYGNMNWGIVLQTQRSCSLDRLNKHFEQGLWLRTIALILLLSLLIEEH